MSWKFLINRRKVDILVVKDVMIQGLGTCVIEDFFLQKFDHGFAKLHSFYMCVPRINQSGHVLSVTFTNGRHKGRGDALTVLTQNDFLDTFLLCMFNHDLLFDLEK
jgi:hypothetical protein